jgi:HEAT repeat protein
MAIQIQCPHCNKHLSVEAAFQGKKIRCGHCKKVFVAGDSEPVAVTPVGEIQVEKPVPVLELAPEEPLLPRGKPRRPAPVVDVSRIQRPVGRRRGVLGLVIGCAVAAVVLLLCTGIPATFLLLWRWSAPVSTPDDIVAEGPVAVAPDAPLVADPPKLPPATAPAIDNLVQRLRSRDVFTQSDAAENLARMAPDPRRRAEVVQALKAVIQDRGGLTPRTAAVRALEVWATREDVPFFLTLLDHTDGGVRDAAMAALGRTKDPRAADPLALRLATDREKASQALKDMGPAAEKAVREQLNHPDGGVRAEACKILKVIGTKASHAALKLAVQDPDGNVAAAAREALPPEVRPPLYGPRQTITLNVHVSNPKAWPEMEEAIKKLADSPEPFIKVNTSGDYKWVKLAPVNTDCETFSRKIKFGKVVAVHSDQRLIYVDPEQ